MSFISNINNNNNNNNKLCAIFILFNKETKKLLPTTARELSNNCAIVRPYNQNI